MGFQDVAFLPPPCASFSTTLKKIVVEAKSSGPPHVLRLWMGVGKDMLPVKYVAPTKPLFVSVEFHGERKTATRI